MVLVMMRRTSPAVILSEMYMFTKFLVYCWEVLYTCRSNINILNLARSSTLSCKMGETGEFQVGVRGKSTAKRKIRVNLGRKAPKFRLILCHVNLLIESLNQRTTDLRE